MNWPVCSISPGVGTWYIASLGGETMKKVLTLLTTISVLVAFAVPAGAQEEKAEQGKLNIVYFFKVKPAYMIQFESALKEHLVMMKKAGDTWTWNTWQIVTGDRYGEYVINSPYHTWEDLDADAAFHQKRIMFFRLNVIPFVESMSREICEFTEYCNIPEDPEQWNLMEIGYIWIKEGHIEDFQKVIKKAHEALEAGGKPFYYIWSVQRSGGYGTRFSLINPHKNWAEFATPEKTVYQYMVEAFGEEETQKLGGLWIKSVMKTMDAAVQFRPDLSYMPE
jgi:hypothetical protein